MTLLLNKLIPFVYIIFCCLICIYFIDQKERVSIERGMMQEENVLLKVELARQVYHPWLYKRFRNGDLIQGYISGLLIQSDDTNIDISSLLSELSQSPYDQSLIYVIAKGYYLKGTFDEALFYSKRLYDLNPKSYLNNYLLVQIYGKLGDIHKDDFLFQSKKVRNDLIGLEWEGVKDKFEWPLLDEQNSFRVKRGIKMKRGKFYKSTKSGWTDSGFKSKAILPFMQEGWVEIIVDTPPAHRAFGFGSLDKKEKLNLQNMKYGFLLNSAGVFCIYEHGTKKTEYSKFVKNDVLQLKKEADSIHYSKNNIRIFSSKLMNDEDLVLYGSLHSYGATLPQIQISFND